MPFSETGSMGVGITLDKIGTKGIKLVCRLGICSVEVFMVHPDGDFQGELEYIELNFRGKA